MGNASPKGKVRQEPLRETATSSGIPAATDSFVAKSLETHKDTPDGVPETPEPDVREEACIAEVRDGDCVEQGTGRNNRKTRGARSPAPATSSWVDGVLASSEELSPFEEDMVVVRMSDLLKSTQDQLQAFNAIVAALEIITSEAKFHGHHGKAAFFIAARFNSINAAAVAILCRHLLEIALARVSMLHALPLSICGWRKLFGATNLLARRRQPTAIQRQKEQKR